MTQENRQAKITKKSVLKFFQNPWKVAFITLLAILIGFILFLGYRTSIPRIDTKKVDVIERSAETPILEVSMTKTQVNDVLNYYSQELMEKSDVDYTFSLDTQALIDGTFSLLGHETHFYLYFEPFVLADGNIQLQAKDLSVGSLNVPIPAMINYITHSVKFPEWIEIEPDKQMIIIRLDLLELDNGFKVRAKQINLLDDNIRFEVLLSEPKKKDATKK